MQLTAGNVKNFINSVVSPPSRSKHGAGSLPVYMVVELSDGGPSRLPVDRISVVNDDGHDVIILESNDALVV